MNATTIVLVDDHHVVRQGLRAFLEAQPDFQVVGEAPDGLDALQLVDKLKPDVLVADLRMPNMNGLELARQTRKVSPCTRVVILSMHENEAYVLEALRAGALGYVLKNSKGNELVKAVAEAAAGRRYLSAPLSDRAIEVYLQKAEATNFDPYETLTAREREVLQLAAEGHSTPAIAGRLFISPRTAETHRANLMRKLELRGQTDLIRYALRRGILPLEEEIK